MSVIPVPSPRLSSTSETSPESSPQLLRSNCQGLPPLDARLAGWMTAICCGPLLPELMRQHGSPLNLLCPQPFQRNIRDLQQTAADRQLNFEVYFARKANKCLTFVDTVRQLGCGLDTASAVELQQALDRGINPARTICTAAVKSAELLQLCLQSGTTIALDNLDELQQVRALAVQQQRPAVVALRVSGFRHQQGRLESRFGFDYDQVRQVVRQHCPPGEDVTIAGVHFHLDGYDRHQRASAIRQSLQLIDDLKADGHPLQFLDIGGGFPMNYLESQQQWDEFWQQHRQALLQQQPAVTYRNHGLGFVTTGDTLVGRRNCYPYYQKPVQSDWLALLLDDKAEQQQSLAEAIRQRNLQLRCEPGRSILDGCGLTAARVEYRKQRPDGDWLIGLSMNRTQCRTTSDDFLVDPLLVPYGGTGNQNSQSAASSMRGYLVGAYCTESELLMLRRFSFPQGVNIGDLIVFPNTAGYLMHFLESRSHQFPLAKNVIVDESDLSAGHLDDIDTDISAVGGAEQLAVDAGHS